MVVEQPESWMEEGLTVDKDGMPPGRLECKAGESGREMTSWEDWVRGARKRNAKVEAKAETGREARRVCGEPTV